MKPNQDPENDERLRALLRSWVVDTPLPPRFQEQVWRRIERADLQPASPFWAGLLHLVEIALPRPKVAFAYVSVLLALGLTVGAWAAQVKTSHTESSLGLRYVQSVDPYNPAGVHP
jgi:hypothetical protein